MENLNSLFKNKTTVAGSSCEKVLGNVSGVSELGSIWKLHADKFMLISADSLLSFCQGADFDAKESAAFRLGLSAIPSFLEACLKESEDAQRKLQEKEIDNASQKA